MNPVLALWNAMRSGEAASDVLPCCGSERWAAALANARPLSDETALLRRSDEIWWQLDEADWQQAFAMHPRIGERKAPEQAFALSAVWSNAEQQGVLENNPSVLAALAEGNRRYEERFGRIYIVCAIGKTAWEMLEILNTRLANDDKTELREAAEQQRQITALRLRKWLDS
jgi:2-oxo-4-hydroxy-4-carboxy-5-ureidoimidazoline decarboxylase